MGNKVKLQKQITEIETLKWMKRGSPQLYAWEKKTSRILENIFGNESSYKKDFDDISYSSSLLISGMTEDDYQNPYIQWLDQAELLLKWMLDEIEEVNYENQKQEGDALITLENICNKFHSLVRQLRTRYSNRSTIDIDDEYDVQDFLHILLKLHFDDVRPEEYSPSYAWGNSRTDFLLKNEEIMIEVKKTRKSLKSKELWEQLIIDIVRYKNHPDCKKLVCFVYDPEWYVHNPRWMETDLETSKDMDVKVFIRPI